MLFRSVLALLLTSASALFLDEAGVTDWSRSGLGAFKAAAFQARRLYVATELGVLAGLNTRTGQIAWRRVYPEGAAIDSMKVGKGTIATLSEGGRMLHLWSSVDGALLWDAPVGRDGASAGAASLLHVQDAAGMVQQGIAAMSGGGVVEMRGMKAGNQAWQWSDPSGQLRPAALLQLRDATATNTGVLYVLCAKQGGSNDDAVVVSLDAMSGEMVDSVTHTGAAPGGKIIALLTADRSRAALATIGVGGAVQLYDVARDAPATATAATAASLGAIAGDASLVAAFSRSGSGGARVYALTEEGGALALSAVGSDEQPRGAVTLAAAATPKRRVVVALSAAEGGETLSLALTDAPSSSGAAAEQAVSLVPALEVAAHGAIVAAHVQAFERRAGADGGFGLRVLVIFADHTAAMVQSGKVVWRRSEALASVRQLEFSGMRPTCDVGDGEAPTKSVAEMDFADRLAAQAATLSTLPSTLSKLPAALGAVVQQLIPKGVKGLGGLGGAAATSGVRTAVLAAEAADALGGEVSCAAQSSQSQIVLLMSAPGVLFAVNSVGGAVLWQTFVGAGARLLPLGNGGGAHDEIAVVTPLSHANAAAASRFALYQVTNGAPVVPATGSNAYELPAFNAAILQAVPLTLGSEQTRLYAVLTAELDVYVVPRTAAAKAAFTAALPTLVLHVLDEAHGVVSGYRVKSAAKASGSAVSASAAFVAESLWDFRLAPPSGAAASSECGAGCFLAHEHIGDAVRETSPAKVKGDASLLLKYLNPHMVALASVASVEAKELRITVLDAVSGRTLHSLVQPNAVAPVSLVWLENWLVYSFWNPTFKRTELATVALFKGAIDRAGLNPWTTSSTQLVGNANGRASSFAPQTVIALHKRFLLPEGVAAMAATETAHSIAPKALLIATKRGQLLQLPLGFVDPRRPNAKPTKEEQKEGLMQFSAHLPTPAAFIVSYNRTIERVAQVATTPAELESSSVVIACGLDIFATRVSPAGGFDILSPSFNAPLLVLVLAAMFGIYLYLKNAAEQKVVDDWWK